MPAYCDITMESINFHRQLRAYQADSAQHERITAILTAQYIALYGLN